MRDILFLLVNFKLNHMETLLIITVMLLVFGLAGTMILLIHAIKMRVIDGIIYLSFALILILCAATTIYLLLLNAN